MNSETWRKIEEGVARIAEVAPADRARWLAEFCAGDEQAKSEIESLLSFETNAANFLETSVTPFAAEILLDGETDFAGKEFGHYRIIREIGRGGMGAVFLAERIDDDFEQQVALKIVRRAVVDRESAKRFRRERQILAALNHPNIAHLYDGGVAASGEPFLAMEYVAGEPLLDFADQRNLSIKERLELFVRICSAVVYAHCNLIVHRDIKPANILVDKTGEPKLLDFGLAKMLDFQTDAEQTATEFRALTPAYASPEQLRGETVTTASDVYSLGVCLYELLTGERPYKFKTDSFEEIFRAVCETVPKRPSETRTNPKSKIQNLKSLKGDLDNIVLKALRKEPEQRYSSVEEFAQDVRRYLNGLPISARPLTVRYRAVKFIKRNRIAVVAAALVLLAIVSGLIVAVWQANVARRERDAARIEKLRTERINRFLREMLSFSNQSITSVSPIAEPKNVTVNEMLDRIAPQIETELAAEPEVQAQVLRTIGASYASQGFYEKAEKYLRQALANQGDAETAETAATQFELGVLSYRQGRFNDAKELLERATSFYLAQQRENSPEYSPARLAQTLDHLGVVKFYLGDAKNGVATLNEALQIAANANLQGNEREVLASVQTNLGGALVVSGETAKAETLLGESLAEFRRFSGAPRWESATTLLMLGMLFLNKNQPDEALKALLESEQILRATLGERNAYLANVLNQQAIALSRKNDLPTAEEKARQSIQILQSVFGEKDITAAQPLTTLGIVLNKANRAREAENYLRRALEIFENQTPRDAASVAQTKIALGDCLLAQNRFAEAEKTVAAARDEAAKNFGEQNPTTQAAASVLAKIREKQNKPNSSQKLK